MGRVSLLSASAWNRLQAEFKNLTDEQKFDVLGIVFNAIGLDRWHETAREEFDYGGGDDNPDTVMALFKTRLEQNSVIDGYIPWLAKHARAGKLDTGTSLYYDMKASFRAICVWASETKTDIGKVSIEEALEKAKAYVPRAAKKALQDSDANPVVYRFPDGYKVVNLKTDEALKLEGDRMKHCVGNYCSNVKEGTSVIYSLRSPEGDPEKDVTLEYNPEKGTFAEPYGQMFGPGNRKPNPEQQKYLIEFLEAKFPHDKVGLLMAGKPAKDIDLNGADLTGAILREAYLGNANLEGADLEGADLEGAYLGGAYLTGAILTHAILMGADLMGADLTYAILIGANLYEANLRGADLEGADLRSANLSGANLEGAKHNDKTVWPVGFKPPADAIQVSATMNVIEAAAPEKYKHIDFKPPEGVRKAAKRGLEMRREFKRGGTMVGVARARDLAGGKTISPSTARRMKAYFDRHQPDQKAEGFSSGEDGYPSAGRVAWELWGGDAGYSWAKKLVKQMNSADEKGKVKSSVVLACGCDESCGCGCQDQQPGGGQPPSDMTISNLKQIVRDAQELLGLLHEDMELMGWAEDKITQAKVAVDSVKNYVLTDFAEHSGHSHPTAVKPMVLTLADGRMDRIAVAKALRAAAEALSEKP